MERMLKLVCCAVSLIFTAFAGSSPAGGRLDFVTAPAALKRACVATARFVGYPVPCPLLLPRGLAADSSDTRCAGGLVFAPFRSVATCEGARGWRGWVAGAGTTPGGARFALTAAPRVEPDIAKLVNGPAWYSGAHVQLLGHSRVNGHLVQWALVPAATNDGSQFSDAVAGVWSAGGHSYAIGFAAAGGKAAARTLGRRLLEGVALVGAQG